jgi:hypothetical protein
MADVNCIARPHRGGLAPKLACGVEGIFFSQRPQGTCMKWEMVMLSCKAIPCVNFYCNAGPWPRLLDVDQTLEFPVQLDGSRGQARRVLGSIQAVERRLRADRAGSTQSTLGTLSSLSATASLTDKLNFSQYSLGEYLL